MSAWYWILERTLTTSFLFHAVAALQIVGHGSCSERGERWEGWTHIAVRLRARNEWGQTWNGWGGGVIIKTFPWVFAIVSVCTVFSSKQLIVCSNTEPANSSEANWIELAVTGQNTCSLLCPPPYDSKHLQEHNNNTSTGWIIRPLIWEIIFLIVVSSGFSISSIWWGW